MTQVKATNITVLREYQRNGRPAYDLSVAVEYSGDGKFNTIEKHQFAAMAEFGNACAFVRHGDASSIGTFTSVYKVWSV